MTHIRKGDTVQVMAGKDKGLTGTVIRVITEADRVIVEGVNRIKKHTRKNETQRGVNIGGIITTEAPVHISNIMLVEDGKPTRVGFRRENVEKTRPDGSTYQSTRSVRFSKRTGKDI
jgi:large subunit ribosomal protein L24